MTFIAFLISLAIIYWFLLSFLSELTKPELPKTVMTHFDNEEQESTAA